MLIDTTIIPTEIESFLQPIAAKFLTNIQQDCQESILHVPKKRGEGKISAFGFPCGISLLLFDFTPRQDLELNISSTKTTPIQFNFCVEGTAIHIFDNSQCQYHLLPLQGSITASPRQSFQQLRFPANRKIVLTILAVDRKEYLDKVDCQLKQVPENLANLFRDVKAGSSFFYQSNYSVAISECIQSIINTTYKGLVRSTFMEALALELLGLQIKQYKDDLLSSSQKVIVREQDTEKIMQARKILKESIAEAPTIPELAKMTGINQQKLKKGFKQLFNQTIGQYLRSIRLNQAKLLLLEGSLSVIAISQQVGYQNSSHFARRFKEKFGVLPKDYQKHIQATMITPTKKFQQGESKEVAL